MNQANLKIKETCTERSRSIMVQTYGNTNNFLFFDIATCHAEHKTREGTAFGERVRCESSGNYTEFYFTENKKLLVTKTMKEYEDLLAPQGFFRVHQSHLINTAYIQEFIKSDETLRMIDNSRIPVSTRRKAEVMKMLEEL